MTDGEREAEIREAVSSAYPVQEVEKHLAFLLARLDAERARLAEVRGRLRRHAPANYAKCLCAGCHEFRRLLEEGTP